METLATAADQTTNTRVVCLLPDLSLHAAAVAVVLKVKVGTALPPHCIPQTSATPPYPLATPPYSPWLHPLIPPGYHPFYPWPRTQVGTAVSSQQEVLPLYNLSTISSVAPTSGPANGRASFVLTGTNLNGCATPPLAPRPGYTHLCHTPLPPHPLIAPLAGLLTTQCNHYTPSHTIVHSYTSSLTTPCIHYTPPHTAPSYAPHPSHATPPYSLHPLAHYTSRPDKADRSLAKVRIDQRESANGKLVVVVAPAAATTLTAGIGGE